MGEAGVITPHRLLLLLRTAGRLLRLLVVQHRACCVCAVGAVGSAHSLWSLLAATLLLH